MQRIKKFESFIFESQYQGAAKEIHNKLSEIINKKDYFSPGGDKYFYDQFIGIMKMFFKKNLAYQGKFWDIDDKGDGGIDGRYSLEAGNEDEIGYLWGGFEVQTPHKNLIFALRKKRDIYSGDITILFQFYPGEVYNPENHVTDYQLYKYVVKIADFYQEDKNYLMADEKKIENFLSIMSKYFTEK